MRHIKDLNELFTNNIDYFKDLSFLGKSFKFYFKETNTYQDSNQYSDIFWAHSKIGNVRISFNLKMLGNECLSKNLKEKDCLNIHLSCELRLTKKEKLSCSYSNFIVEAKEEDYINYLLGLKQVIVDEELEQVKSNLRRINNKIQEQQLLIQKEQDKLEIINNNYPIFLL
jgi:hypothetical protein